MKKTTWAVIGLSALFLAAGLWAGYGYGMSVPRPIPSRVIRENSADYRFINPILLIGFGDKSSFPQYKALESQIKSFIDKSVAQRDATDVSVYVRDMVDESWMGVNETEKYTPSSMLKVSIMMAYQKIQEVDPTIMTEKQLYTFKDDPGQNFKPTHPLATGRYSNADLIKAMIEDSDNTAEEVLSSYILNSERHNAFAQIFVDLRMPLPTATSGPDFLSAQEYSRLFRALYNGAYLPNSFSEYALDMLSHTTFDGGLVAGVPAGTTVAHKFGEQTTLDDLTGAVIERQLHDCGIVYKPNDPYVVCVMTRGTDFSKLKAVISLISSIVYQNIGKPAR
ncbi:MAG TPA: serine hydrolase [Candidatus Paceibacterota bacterium]|nr:serine hydrolase [Candidatus Paceibacterota bacterium]